MSLGPFLSRELTISVRSTRAFTERRNVIFVTSIAILGTFQFWDHMGWDRTSIVGAHQFGLALFGQIILGLSIFALGLVAAQVASSIAQERDRKTLDALLASRFASAEIVLGAVASGMLRFLNAAAGTLPLVVLIVFLGGVAPVWAILAVVGVASLVLTITAFSVVVSVEAKTARRAKNYASGWFGLFMVFPCLYLMFWPFVWPGAPRWLTVFFNWLLDASPLGLLMNLRGVLPRRGGPVWGVGRMVAWQLGVSLVLLTVAIVRLRPASRGLHDLEGETTRLQQLKAALRRPAKRPPCSDDPVFWCEIYTTKIQGRFTRWSSRVVGVSLFGAVCLGALWFAGPAFVELRERGYHPSPEARTMPDLNPLARMIVSLLSKQNVLTSPVGQARLEFNIILRQFTAIYVMVHIAMAFAGVVESITNERRRDTWLGLIATPLTGREILRAKMLGLQWRSRGAGLLVIALWTSGLVCGAIHPLGYAAGLTFLVISAAFYSAQGARVALLECNPDRKGPPSVSMIQIPLVLIAALVFTAGPIILGWAALLTYEDVQAMIESAPFPELGDTKLKHLIPARTLALIWLAGSSVLAIWAYRQIRKNEEQFDVSIGRPVRAIKVPESLPA